MSLQSIGNHFPGGWTDPATRPAYDSSHDGASDRFNPPSASHQVTIPYQERTGLTDAVHDLLQGVQAGDAFGAWRCSPVIGPDILSGATFVRGEDGPEQVTVIRERGRMIVNLTIGTVTEQGRTVLALGMTLPNSGASDTATVTGRQFEYDRRGDTYYPIAVAPTPFVPSSALYMSGLHAVERARGTASTSGRETIFGRAARKLTGR